MYRDLGQGNRTEFSDDTGAATKSSRDREAPDKAAIEQINVAPRAFFSLYSLPLMNS
jgi:hypothetical protein